MSVTDTIASRCTTAAEAVSAANAVNEARVIVGLLHRQRNMTMIDVRLHELELSYFRRADELERSAAR